MKTQPTRNLNSFRSRATRLFASAGTPQRNIARYAILLSLVAGSVLSTSGAGLSDRLYVAADFGVALRELDGPLRSQPQVFRGSDTEFRKNSSDTEPYGAVRLGVKVNKFFRIEAGYQDFGTTRVRMIPPPHVMFIQPPPENFDFSDTAFTFDPVFTWTINPRVKLHGFWCVAFNRADVTLTDYRPQPLIIPIAGARSSDSTQSRLGVGADFQLTAKLNLRAGLNYQRFSSFTKEGWLAHAGLAYTF